MTGKELGSLLGDVISELEGASLEIDGTVSLLMEVDDKAIVQDEVDDEIAADQPYMTIDELGVLIDDALGELESIIMEIEGARDLLQSIEVNALTASASAD